MKLNLKMTLIFATVSMLVSINSASAETSAAATSTTTAPAKKEVPSTPDFGFSFGIARNTSLVDFQDGSRADSIDYQLIPSVKMSFGSLKAKIAYSQDLRDQYSKTASDWADVPVILTIPSSLKWLSYSFTAVIPSSQLSTKRDQLQTSLSGALNLAFEPVEGLSVSGSVSAGRNLHAYEEDINGKVLNQYSSNQSLSVAYTLGDWSAGVDFINRSRWTYQGNTKSSFEMNEELGYSINDHYALAIGHNNQGPTLKANGSDSNIELFNENTSTVYASLTVTY